MVVPGIPHHITQRGNRREDVFFEDDDRQHYLQLLLEYAARHGLKTVAYCLMSNHVHLVSIPERADTLGSVFRPVDLRYTQYINWSHRISGRLWQGRFFSCALDEEHFWAAIRYVERNPVRAGIVRKAVDYPWSSAAAHCGLRSDAIVSALPAPVRVRTEDWSSWLAEKEDEKVVATLRLHTRTGRPAGSKEFVAGLESRLGRRLQPRSVGRPRKYRTETVRDKL